ncbi:zinc finger and BTB domain-containing protein 49-like isoform X2 [Drosophila rhopaloa]|uniref:C2H2-type domain-containing protein n=1 Tax=Drosophila rhopaloa TaxID=1041015 RepID=A0ABM5J7Q8_DRORH|nr:zinc finger and BTB domain-containing protein 49-like isoform X2 [Drosophila rhopaloa]
MAGNSSMRTLTDQYGVPTKICLSCLLDLNAAVAFRQRLIRTNYFWQEALITLDKTKDTNISSPKKNDPRVEIVPVSTSKRKSSVRKKITPLRNRKSDQIPLRSKVSKEEDFVLFSPEDSLDPSNGEEDLIEVKNEPLFSDIELEDSGRRDSQPLKRVEIYKEPTPLDEAKKNCERAAARRTRAKEQALFFCEQCGKTFNEKGSFDLHLLRHSGLKQFQCNECERKEFSAHLLRLHVRIKHRGEKPYKCKYCGQRFDICIKRLRHERRHEQGSEAAPEKGGATLQENKLSVKDQLETKEF